MYIMRPYDEALEQILKHGERTSNRTGIDTLSISGIQSRYRINERFPLLTGRKVWPKAIFAELLWFISGSTNNKDLQALGSDIWTPWVDKKFEQENSYIEGALGKIYGFQLRHFGGFYGNGDKKQFDYDEYYGYYNKEYGEDGFDQLKYMVDTLKSDPDSRRNLFSLWNPKDLPYQRLPCCHYSFQVLVKKDKITGLLTQRSCDWPVGIPANIQFYSSLIYMLAQQTGYEPYELVHWTADSHIYVDQIEAVEEYLSREKPDSPTLDLKPANDIFSYNMDNFVLKDYQPLSPIKIPVAV